MIRGPGGSHEGLGLRYAQLGSGCAQFHKAQHFALLKTLLCPVVYYTKVFTADTLLLPL